MKSRISRRAPRPSISPKFDADDVEDIRRHLGETYAWFIGQGCEIKLNRVPIAATSFANWAVPPVYRPRHVEFQIEPVSGEFLIVSITGGLIVDRDPEADNCGVYFICNHRLIVKELKVRGVAPTSDELPERAEFTAKPIMTDCLLESVFRLAT